MFQQCQNVSSITIVLCSSVECDWSAPNCDPYQIISPIDGLTYFLALIFFGMYTGQRQKDNFEGAEYHIVFQVFIEKFPLCSDVAFENVKEISI